MDLPARKLILWALLLPASAGAGTRPPLDPTCALRYAQIKVEPTAISMGGGPSPPFHVLNLPKVIQFLRGQGTVAFQAKKIARAGEEHPYLCNKFLLCFLVTGYVHTPQGPIVTIKDAAGDLFSLPAPEKEKQFWLDFTRISEVARPRPELSAKIASLKESWRKTGEANLAPEELAKFLSDRQLRGFSGTFAVTGDKLAKFTRGIRAANQILADHLANDRPLTRETFERLNWLANQGIDPYEQEEKAMLAGIMRGTSDRAALSDGIFVRPDMSQVQVAQGEGGTMMNVFLPAAEVPAAMDKLILDINTLGPNSDPLTVFSLYKSFIDTHPFADGNHRVGRMLLNYMLLKAKLPPLDIAPSPIYLSPSDLLQKYVELMAKRP